MSLRSPPDRHRHGDVQTGEHAETINASDFPCAYATTSSYANNNGSTTLQQQQVLNSTGPTVYSDPDFALKAFLAASPGAQ